MVPDVARRLHDIRKAADGPAGSPEPAVAGRGAAGAEAAVTEYIRDEVLGRQPAASREFMLRTSVTTSLTGALADALTGADGTGSRILERLSRETGLVDPVGADLDGYRYHPMLREVLAAELRRELPHEVPQLLHRAASWHADRGHAVEAVRLAADAGDWDQGAHAAAITVAPWITPTLAAAAHKSAGSALAR